MFLLNTPLFHKIYFKIHYQSKLVTSVLQSKLITRILPSAQCKCQDSKTDVTEDTHELVGIQFTTVRL